MADEVKSKFDSRKFLVWVVWLFITVIVIAFCTVTMIITRQIVAELTSLIEKTLAWFFAISMMYLGVNVGQKVGFAFADSLATVKKLSKTDNKEEVFNEMEM